MNLSIKNSTLTITFLSITFLNSCVPPFDSETPDTENNKYHYEHLINVKLTPDVNNIYAYGDELGIDASYYLAFECNYNTALRIIKSNNFLQDSETGIPLVSEFKMKWWNESEIDSLTRYVYKNESKTYFKYFWYNELNKHAYFLDFDL